MPDLKELKRAFGRADDGFIDNVYHTLADLHMKKNRRPVKGIGLRLAAAVALLAALTGTALALTNTRGILDFLSGRRDNAVVLPEASEIVQTNVPQVSADQFPDDTNIADFSVREAVYDGHDFYIIVDVKPASDDYLLLGPDAYPEDPVQNMGPLFSDRTGTIADYAQANGKEMIQTNARVDEAGVQSADFLLRQDGTLTYMLNGSLIDDSDKADLELLCIVAAFADYDGREVVLQENIKRSTLNFTLENTGFSALASSIGTAEYTDCGVRIDSITLKASEMAVYAELRYTIVDQAKFDATETGLCFEFLDSHGNRLPSGAAGGGGTIIEDNVHYVVESTIAAMEALPGEVTVRGFNCWDKNRYETHTFEMR